MCNIRFSVITVCTLFLLVCSCNKREGAHSSVDADHELVINEADTSFIGTITAIDGDNITLTKERSEERLTFDCSSARNAGHILGDILSVISGVGYAFFFVFSAASAVSSVFLIGSSESVVEGSPSTVKVSPAVTVTVYTVLLSAYPAGAVVSFR